MRLSSSHRVVERAPDVLFCRKPGDSSEVAMKVEGLPVGFGTHLKVAERDELSHALPGFFCQPDAITAEVREPQQGGIMGAEEELRRVLIMRGVCKELHQPGGEQRMKGAVQLIDDQGSPVLEHVVDGRKQSQQRSSTSALQVGLKRDRFLPLASVGELKLAGFKMGLFPELFAQCLPRKF